MAASTNVPITDDTVEIEVGDEERDVDSVMVTVSIVHPDGRSHHASKHMLVDDSGIDEHEVAQMVIRAGLGAAMAVDDDWWLALRQALSRYNSTPD